MTGQVILTEKPFLPLMAPHTGASDESNEEVSGNYPDSNEHGAEAIEGKEEYGEDSYSGEDDDDCESVSDRTSCSSCDTSHVSDIDLSYNSEVHHQDNDSIPLSLLSDVGGRVMDCMQWQCLVLFPPIVHCG